MRRLKTALAYGAGAVCLVWLFYDLDWRRLAAGMTGIHWGWMLLASAFNVLSYVAQGWRWEMLVRPLGRTTTARASEAIYAGLFLNEILPLRPGELARVYVMSRWLGVSFSAVIPSLMLERFFDAVWLALSIGVAAIVVKLPDSLLTAADILGVLVLAGTIVFACVVLRRRGHGRGWLGRVDAGLREIGRSRLLYLSFAASLLYLVGQILAFWLMMRAYGIEASVWAGTVVLLIVHLGTLVPNTPANVGTFQFFTVLGLELFGVNKAVAAGFSLVVFVLLTAPLCLLGSLALSRTGMSVASVRRQVGAWSFTNPDESAKSRAQ
jgi:uncharacterized membrane protein YbhN (UPF0104 family)